jgi:NAD(P)H dehydrogenase (quinone)
MKSSNLADASSMLSEIRLHFKAIKVDQQEQLLVGVDNSAAEIVGQPLTTPERFIAQHRHLLA